MVVRKRKPRPPKFKSCPFCHKKTEPYYLDKEVLKEFITIQGKILPRIATNVCSKHQRQLTKAIKRARVLAVLPFTQVKTLVKTK